MESVRKGNPPMSWKENNQNWVDRMDNAAFGFGQFLGRLIYISTKKPGNKRTFPDFSPPRWDPHWKSGVFSQDKGYGFIGRPGDRAVP